VEPAETYRPQPRSISYFFPAFNEEGNLAPMVARALEVLPRFVSEYEVIIVNDGSRDATETEAQALGVAHPEVVCVNHSENRGYGEALRSGFHAARHEAVVFTDGDRQFDLEELALLWPLLGDADVVAGYRIKRADPPHRLLIAWVYKLVLRLLFGLRMRDVDCAFKLIRAEVAHSVEPGSGGAFFSAEFLLRARHRGFRIVEVGVHHHPRLVGKPKGATPRVVLRTFREMFALVRTFRQERQR
jgi:glycosyltransferase involved in cell wall biosynthesis